MRNSSQSTFNRCIYNLDDKARGHVLLGTKLHMADSKL
jgi:hypothetical protein